MDRQFIKENYDALMGILNSINVGVFISDGDGQVLAVNDASLSAGGAPREEIIEKNIHELVECGYIEESVTVKIFESKKEESLIQNLGDGSKVYVTGRPVFETGGGKEEIELVICTERDITEIIRLKEILEQKSKKYENELEYLKKQNITMWGNLIAEDDISKKLAQQAKRIAASDTTVLLTGASGTGKEVYANFIYENSSRAGKPCIKINCAAIPESLIESELFGYEKGTFTGANLKGKMGIFEMANTGTLFLDEIGELSMHLQPKLLRVLQEKEIFRIGGTRAIPLDIRIIVATNKNLEQEIIEGRFREDLYYRLNVMPIELPPLKGRKKDIRKLTHYFIDNFNREYKTDKIIAEEAVRIFENAEWKGNIRELENIIERLMISVDDNEITVGQVRNLMSNTNSYETDFENKTMQELMDEYEYEILKSMMEKHQKASKVSNALNINKTTLHRRLKKHNLI